MDRQISKSLANGKSQVRWWRVILYFKFISTNCADILGRTFFPILLLNYYADFGSCQRGKLLLICNQFASRSISPSLGDMLLFARNYDFFQRSKSYWLLMGEVSCYSDMKINKVPKGFIFQRDCHDSSSLRTQTYFRLSPAPAENNVCELELGNNFCDVGILSQSQFISSRPRTTAWGIRWKEHSSSTLSWNLNGQGETKVIMSQKLFPGSGSQIPLWAETRDSRKYVCVHRLGYMSPLTF